MPSTPQGDRDIPTLYRVLFPLPPPDLLAAVLLLLPFVAFPRRHHAWIAPSLSLIPRRNRSRTVGRLLGFDSGKVIGASPAGSRTRRSRNSPSRRTPRTIPHRNRRTRYMA